MICHLNKKTEFQQIIFNQKVMFVQDDIEGCIWGHILGHIQIGITDLGRHPNSWVYVEGGRTGSVVDTGATIKGWLCPLLLNIYTGHVGGRLASSWHFSLMEFSAAPPHKLVRFALLLILAARQACFRGTKATFYVAGNEKEPVRHRQG